MKGIKFLEVADTTWEDERGWGLNLLTHFPDDGSSIEDLHVVSLKPGMIRGNHLHRKGTEWLLISNGPVLIAWRSGSGDLKEKVMDGEGPCLVEIPAGVPHAVKNISERIIYLVALGDVKERETFPAVLL